MALSPLKITNFLLASGQPVAGGEVCIRLNKDCVGPSGQVSTRKVSFELDNNGAPIGPPVFWPNSELTPDNSVYIMSVSNAEGELIVVRQSLTIQPAAIGPIPSAGGFGSGMGQSFPS